MNIVDYVIIGILGISVLVGLYRGFVSSVLNTGSCLISFGLSFWLSPKLVDLIKKASLITIELGMGDVVYRSMNVPVEELGREVLVGRDRAIAHDVRKE